MKNIKIKLWAEVISKEEEAEEVLLVVAVLAEEEEEEEGLLNPRDHLPE